MYMRQNDLSTFAAHMGGISRILAISKEVSQGLEAGKGPEEGGNVGDDGVRGVDHGSEGASLSAQEERRGPYCLVLVDEIASGTDPGEGEALAQAILERLVSVSASPHACHTRVRLAVSTHYPQVRHFAAVDPCFLLAAMASRDGTAEPTYRLLLGAGGTSRALATAARAGLALETLERAKLLLGSDAQSVEDELQRLQNAVGAVDAQLRSFHALQSSVMQSERRIAEMEARISEGAARARQLALRRLKTCLAEAQSKVEDIYVEAVRREESLYFDMLQSHSGWSTEDYSLSGGAELSAEETSGASKRRKKKGGGGGT